MLCDGCNPILKIIGVEHMHWQGGSVKVSSREYSALAFRLGGSASIEGAQNRYTVSENDILYLPQNMCYTAEYTDTELLVIHFVTEKSGDKIEVYPIKNREQLYRLFLRAHDIWESKKTGFSTYTMAILYSILGTLLEEAADSSLPKSFLTAMAFIDCNYKSSELSVAEVCERSGICETAFRRLFKGYYKKTPVEYVIELRLELARRLIAEGKTVENAAYESGFNDPKYFARVVKKYYGCTPRAFKKYGK